jgi:hypothetical protein
MALETSIPVRVDALRGCGWRKPGGLYLISDGIPSACTLLPVKLGHCPTCSAGMKPARGWTTVDGWAVVTNGGERTCTGHNHGGLTFPCPLEEGLKEQRKAGLLWIGGIFYKHPEDWTAEAHRLGVSRRIARLPNDLEIGKTWVLVAHRDALPSDEIGNDGQPKMLPAIFHAFRPDRVEYVTRGDESDEEIERMRKRGITPVKVVREGEQTPLDLDAVS